MEALLKGRKVKVQVDSYGLTNPKSHNMRKKRKRQNEVDLLFVALDLVSDLKKNESGVIIQYNVRILD